MNSHPSGFDAAALSLSPAVEDRIGKTASMIEAGFSDAARLASERVRRQMGWPGLSQSWGKSKEPSTHQEFQDAVSEAVKKDEEYHQYGLEDEKLDQLLGSNEYQVDPNEQDFHDTLRRRALPDLGSEPYADDIRAEKEYRDRRRKREERLSDETPGPTFEEIANDPAALRGLKDIDVIEFEVFTTGETRQRFLDEARRRGL